MSSRLFRGKTTPQTPLDLKEETHEGFTNGKGSCAMLRQVGKPCEDNKPDHPDENERIESSGGADLKDILNHGEGIDILRGEGTPLQLHDEHKSNHSDEKTRIERPGSAEGAAFEDKDKTALATRDRSTMSEAEKLAADICEANELIAKNPEFFHQLFEYRKAKLDYDALWEEICKREEILPGADSVLELLPVDRSNEYKQMVLDREGASPRSCGNYADLVHAGTAKQEEFNNLVREVCEASGMDPRFRVQECPEKGNPELGKRRVQIGPLKSKERSEEKARDDYGGDFAKIFDVVRGSILCSHTDQMRACVEALRKRPGCTIVRIKNRFRSPLFTGYRDILILVRVGDPDNGDFCPHICELQIHHVEIMALKSHSHRPYEFFRSYFRGSTKAADGRLEKLLHLVQKEEVDMCQTFARILTKKCEIYHYLLRTFFEDMGLYELAGIACRSELEGMERFLGPDHFHTLGRVAKLGMLLQMQDKLGDAEVLLRRAFEGQEKALGPDHADTLVSVYNLGALLHKQNKLGDAEVLLRRALEWKEKALGPDHTDTLISVSHLGLLLKDQNKLDETEILLRRALEG